MPNNFLNNGQELQGALDLGWISYRYRNYDVTIARFFGIDPISEQYHELTPYQFASNNPVTNIELEGLEGVNANEVDEIAKKAKRDAGAANKIIEDSNPTMDVSKSNETLGRKSENNNESNNVPLPGASTEVIQSAYLAPQIYGGGPEIMRASEINNVPDEKAKQVIMLDQACQNPEFSAQRKELQEQMFSSGDRKSPEYQAARDALTAFERTAPAVVAARDRNTDAPGMTFHLQEGVMIFLGKNFAGTVVGEHANLYQR